MTSPSLKQLREQLKRRVYDLKISEHLLKLGDRKPGYVKSETERMYENLENWIFENIGGKKISTKEEPEEVFVEPDTNDPSQFPAEGNDIDLGF